MRKSMLRVGQSPPRPFGRKFLPRKHQRNAEVSPYAEPRGGRVHPLTDRPQLRPHRYPYAVGALSLTRQVSLTLGAVRGMSETGATEPV